MITITLPDNSKKEFKSPITSYEIANSISEGLARATIAIKVNEKIIDANTPINTNAKIQLLTFNDKEGREIYWHSAAHLLAHAIKRLYPKAKPTIGPALEEGFYYDFDELTITENDIEKIEAEMKKIAKENFLPQRIEYKTKDEAKKAFKNNNYKVEMIDSHEEGSSAYEQGDFIDLCRGPHVPRTGMFKAIKITKIAAAYWRGNQDNKQLTRIYGIAFPDNKLMNEYTTRIAEAAKRNHRKIGREQQLFHIDEDVGAGLILWTPKGSIIRQQLQNFISEELTKQDYSQVFTPHIGKLSLYRTSGHYPYYQDSQYPPIIERDMLQKLAKEKKSCADLANYLEKGDVEGYLLKPMNCPHHIKIFASQQRSYKDMPIKFAEFGTVYRWEQSGEISGMTRVRGFTQDDAHLFCTEEQVQKELIGCLSLVKLIFNTLGMKDYRVRIGLRDPDNKKYVGESKLWDIAEKDVREAVKTMNVKYTEEQGEAAFYGPKIDFVVKDVVGREWQLGTVQVDYNLPIRFDLNYIGEDGKKHRPVMIHRAPFGSMERFVGVLIEHFAGRFPLWLSPIQIKILPIADRHLNYCHEVAKLMKEKNLRVQVDDRAETLNKKIREAQLDRINYILVVGDKEMTEKSVNVRTRDEVVHGSMKYETLIKKLQSEVSNRNMSSLL